MGEHSGDRRGEGRAAHGGFVGHAVLVGGLTLVSRLLGLVRDAVLAACFGMTAITDAFWIGFLVPNLFRRLFGEVAPAVGDRPGGYTRILRYDKARLGDRAPLALFALVDYAGDDAVESDEGADESADS